MGDSTGPDALVPSTALRTRAGSPVCIFNEGGGDQRVLGAYFGNGVWHMCSWDPVTFKYRDGPGQFALDLVVHEDYVEHDE